MTPRIIIDAITLKILLFASVVEYLALLCMQQHTLYS